MFTWAIENSVMAIGLAAFAVVACRALRAKPALCHLLWALVLIRLVAPPISIPNWPPATWRSSVTERFEDLVALGRDVEDETSPSRSGRAVSGEPENIRRGPAASSHTTAEGSTPLPPGRSDITDESIDKPESDERVGLDVRERLDERSLGDIELGLASVERLVHRAREVHHENHDFVGRIVGVLRVGPGCGEREEQQKRTKTHKEPSPRGGPSEHGTFHIPHSRHPARRV